MQIAFWIAAGAAALAAVCVVGVLVLWRRLAALKTTQQVLLPSGATADLLELQHQHQASVSTLGHGLNDLRALVDTHSAQTTRELAKSIRFQGLVRYDAYRDMGGQQSWSIALLNAAQAGTVITCLHARDHARVYLKEVVDGTSAHRLSPEEMRAIGQAMAR